MGGGMGGMGGMGGGNIIINQVDMDVNVVGGNMVNTEVEVGQQPMGNMNMMNSGMGQQPMGGNMMNGMGMNGMGQQHLMGGNMPMMNGMGQQGAPFLSLGRLCQQSPWTVPVSLSCVGSTQCPLPMAANGGRGGAPLPPVEGSLAGPCTLDLKTEVASAGCASHRNLLNGPLTGPNMAGLLSKAGGAYCPLTTYPCPFLEPAPP